VCDREGKNTQIDSGTGKNHGTTLGLTWGEYWGILGFTRGEGGYTLGTYVTV